MLSNADMSFPSVEDADGELVEITQSNFTNLLKRPDRDLRRRVYESYFDEWESMRNTVAAAYKNSVKADVKTARARNYDTAREAALDGPNVPVEVYDTLVDTVHDNLENLHRHAELKREALEVDDLRMWDLYMPLTGDEGPDLEYDQATEYVVDSLEPLGESTRPGSRRDSSHAGSTSTRTMASSRGLLRRDVRHAALYPDELPGRRLLDVHLAHELGHSMHSELTKEEQPYVYSGYEIFVAEVASTVNEALLTNHLLETVDDPELKKHVLNEFLERVRSTLYRQTLFAEFEHRTHELEEAGEPLTADRLDELYRGLKAEYYEPAVVDDRIAREWMRIPISTGPFTSTSTRRESPPRSPSSTTSSRESRRPPTIEPSSGKDPGVPSNSCGPPAST